MAAGRTFDPERRRASINLREVAGRLEAAADHGGFANSALCQSALRDLGAVWLCGLDEDDDWHRLLDLIIQLLGTAFEDARAIEVAAAQVSPFNAASTLQCLALARWFATGERQPTLQGPAHDHYLRYVDELRPAERSTPTRVYAVAARACAAERFQNAADYVRKMLPDKSFEPAKARNAAELALSLEAGHASEALAERFLKANLGKTLTDYHEVDAVHLLYLASVAGLPGTPKGILQRAPAAYISYLRPPSRTSGRPSTTHTSTAAAGVIPLRPLTPRVIASSEPDGEGREDRAIWRPTDDGWAVRFRTGGGWLGGSVGVPLPELVERSATVVELSSRSYSWELDAYPRLQRGTLDGAALSCWAEADHELPLEVVFAPEITDRHDGRRIATPYPLNRKDWTAALDVGALTRLRAISISSWETDRQRLKRGDAPYVLLPTWLLKSRLAKQLEAIEAQASAHDLADSLALFDVLPRLHTLVLWFPLSASTACFWIERRGGGLNTLLQTLAGTDPVNVMPASATADRWTRLLAQTLSAAAVDRLGPVTIATLRGGLDEERERASLGRFAKVATIETGARLREL